MYRIQMIFTLILMASCVGCSSADSNTISLDGKWDVKLDSQDIGQNQKWFNQNFTDKINLPGTLDDGGYGTKSTTADIGVLTRRHKYYGSAWYNKTIDIPADWQGKEIQLYLERVLWQSTVWVDGKEIGQDDSLCTPHIYSLGSLTPGQHLLSIRIDNRPIHPIGLMGHSYTNQTQTIWNGVIGQVKLTANAPVALGMVRAFGDADAKKVDIEVELKNTTGKAGKGILSYELTERKTGKAFATSHKEIQITSGKTTVTLDLPAKPKLWDEFEANLYDLKVSVQSGPNQNEKIIPVGFRKLARDGQHITINNTKTFFRGNLDCVHFPLTGYPSTDVNEWKRILQIYKDYGLNHIRFHSWTAPKAAFEAADELGIYIQTEVLWTWRELGKDKPGPMDIMAQGSFPKELLDHPGTIDDYVQREMRRVIDAFGNHPSFIFFCIGNEFNRVDIDITGKWMQREKQHDPRHLYAVSTARKISEYCEFSATHAIPNIGWCRDRVSPFNDWDYEDKYSIAPVPIIAHEVGQWPVYPVWSEIDKYTGTLWPGNLENFKAMAVKSGIVNQDQDLRAASGAQGMDRYKEQIESHFRTPSCSGFQLLSIQDFSGQGEALVGWLDAFYDSKGIVTPERFRRWCDKTVMLSRMKKYVYSNDEKISVEFEVANYDRNEIKNAQPLWQLEDTNGKILQSGKLPIANIATGGITKLGKIEIDISKIPTPIAMRLTAGLEGTKIFNDWDIWSFAKEPKVNPANDIVICQYPKEALTALNQGKKVLLCAYKLGDKRNQNIASYTPLYWSSIFFKNKETLGAMVNKNHKALADFPTENYLDWQWLDLCNNAKGFQLNSLPESYRPIVQPVTDFHYNLKLGTIFEFNVGSGKLLVCGYDIINNLQNRPPAAQLRYSLLNYMQSDAFTPNVNVTKNYITDMFPIVEKVTVAVPKEFEKSVLYVNAGGKHPSNGNVPWQLSVDDIKIQEKGFNYKVTCQGVWKDNVATAWHNSTPLQVDIDVPIANLYDLYVHFWDWNDNGRSGSIEFEDRKYILGPHAGKGQWVKLEVLREDCLDGKISLKALGASGPNLMISSIALIPRN
ncbi:MAG: glycoside hydrolase family 2 [Phycisphaerae bacterium]|nr:glycoside hydrolase family 2 [Phycisphaerae bacterium]